jgi:hypothetical protein
MFVFARPIVVLSVSSPGATTRRLDLKSPYLAGIFKHLGKFAFDLTVIQVEYKGRKMALRYSLVI